MISNAFSHRRLTIMRRYVGRLLVFKFKLFFGEHITNYYCIVCKLCSFVDIGVLYLFK